LGKERAKGRVPRWTELDGANGRVAGYWARASRSGQPFIGNWGGKGEHGEQGLGLKLLRGKSNRKIMTAAEAPAAALAIPQAAWRSGEAPAEGARAVEGQ
jgi:hypothetical protein